jgi:deferrochelatase/peroxidase EfeB
MRGLQDGIYYKKGCRPGQSVAIMFLRTNKSSSASDIGEIIGNLWETCNDLKNGILNDLKESKIAHPNLYSDLTILIGYGPKIFDLKGAMKKRPHLLSENLQFKEPRWGGKLVEGSDLQYDEDISENHAALEDIVIQFISSSPFITNQCVVEIWHTLFQTNVDKQDGDKVSLSKFYDGFRRFDDRNWMGFHDGVSNIKDPERKGILAIDASQVKSEDNWTVGGTFMGFIRMFIDIQSWWSVKRNEQERMVGRDKISGCPLIGVNKTTNRNVIMRGCPIPGTKEITEKGNEIFRNHPQYGSQMLPAGVSDELLKLSHIAEVRNIANERSRQKEQYRIFRQGFEFLEKTDTYPGVRTGLNFISFQDNPIRLFNTLANINNKKSLEMKTSWKKQGIETSPRFNFNSFFRVGAAGIFFVPPKNTQERFPGAGIFFSTNKMRKHSNQWNS